MSANDIEPVPAPWKLKGTVYSLIFSATKEQIDQATAAGLTYSPLEAASAYADPAGSKPVGGLSMINIIRYTESPAGPYDELILTPGFHEYTVEEDGRRVTKKNTRVTRIYVSQKYTCWNGRKNWNIPKHLASFDFQDNPADGSMTVKVFANDTTGDATEASADTKPLFQATFTPLRYLPAIPMSTKWLGYLGVDSRLAQPPLPEGKGSQGELPGTDKWCSILPVMSSSRTSFGWFDVSQPGEVTACTQEHFWPGLKQWHIGSVMENADIDFGEGTFWDPPKSAL